MIGFKVPAWMNDALCAQVDPDLWFPEVGGPTREAKRICARCPVREQCLEYALSDDRTSGASPFNHGIYGGLSPAERKSILRDREAGAAA